MDRVFFMFPFVKLVHYPIRGMSPLFSLAIVLLIVLNIIGVRKGRIHLIAVIKGFIPFPDFAGWFYDYFIWTLEDIAADPPDIIKIFNRVSPTTGTITLQHLRL